MHKIKEELIASFTDFRLTKIEKYSLQEILEPYREDSETLNYARNQAFAVVREYYLDHQEDQDIALHHLQATRWLESTVKVIDTFRSPKIEEGETEAYFSPGSSPKTHIIDAINQATKSIEICVFTISDNDISKAILDAHQRGIQVRIITDNHKSDDRGSDIDLLEEKGVQIVMDQSEHHMHHKFALIDHKILINGSFNWTRSATLRNNENITLSYESQLIEKFVEEFERLWVQWGR